MTHTKTNASHGKQNAIALACALTAAVAATAGCTKAPSAPVAVIKDKVYVVSPDSLKVTAGIVRGEITEMKVVERVEEGTGRIETPAKLTAKLALKNVSTDQTVRLIAGKIVYIDLEGQPIKLEADRTAPMLRSTSAYGSAERLDPGQDATQPVDAEFPVAALKAKKLKEIRIELSYIPSAFKEEKLAFPVSIRAQQLRPAAAALPAATLARTDSPSPR